MGVVDIFYAEINRIRDAKADKETQKEIARQMVKKALLQFNFEWESFINSGMTGNWRSIADPMLEECSKLFISMAVEINEIFTQEAINELRELATEMRETVNILNIR